MLLDFAIVQMKVLIFIFLFQDQFFQFVNFIIQIENRLEADGLPQSSADVMNVHLSSGRLYVFIYFAKSLNYSSLFFDIGGCLILFD